jgi:preprotein translocase subunit SecG
MSDFSNWDDFGWDTPQDTNSYQDFHDSPAEEPVQDNSWGDLPQGGSWDSTTQNNDWGSPSSDFQDNNWSQSENSQTSDTQNPDVNSNRAPIKFGSKTTAIILAGIFLVLALVFVIFNSIRLKGDNEQAPTQQGSSNNNTQVSTNNSGLIEIPNNIALDYNGDIYSTTATVKNKVKYKDDKQVVYCVVLYVNFGTVAESWNYYCGYNAYNSVKLGDVVVVEYQSPQEGYVSINKVSK